MALKRINLALQGGGAHGAFTWGVLDRLLEEEDLEFSGISGTSAGAMNAVVLVNGDRNASSKLNTRWDFFQFLKEAGRAKTDLWLKTHAKHICEKSTVDIAEMFLKPHKKNLKP